MNGPIAPKDPVKKRAGFYVLYDKVVEATKRMDGKPSQEIYLNDGRLINCAQIVGNISDEGMLDLLKTVKGFRKLVHSIGVSIIAKNKEENVNFVFHMYGKSNLYGGGTFERIPMIANGVEVILPMDQFTWSSDDDIPGKFAFEFEEAGKLATVNIKLYLQDGYYAPEVEEETQVLFDTKEYEAMIKKSLIQQGNNGRIKKAIKKARAGEEVTIAYIGGSITQGAGAHPIHTECYAYKSYEGFQELVGRKDNVRFIKAGVGGTPSELGMIRYERDVLRDGLVAPDIVVVEFAVNDEGDETKGECYESLVCKILNSSNHPAVILLFSVFANDWNLQERLAPVGKNYDLPMVSVKDAVVDQFYRKAEHGRIISKARFFYDVYHPSNAGHKIMADCITHLFYSIDQSVEDKAMDNSIVSPVIGADFQRVHLLDRKSLLESAIISCGSFF